MQRKQFVGAEEAEASERLVDLFFRAIPLTRRDQR
jgi:hypothetical protein